MDRRSVGDSEEEGEEAEGEEAEAPRGGGGGYASHGDDDDDDDDDGREEAAPELASRRQSETGEPAGPSEEAEQDATLPETFSFAPAPTDEPGL